LGRPPSERQRSTGFDVSSRLNDSVRGMMSNATTHLNHIARAIDATDEARNIQSIANLVNVHDLKTTPVCLTEAYPTNSLPGLSLLLFEYVPENCGEFVTIEGLSQVADRAGPQCSCARPIVWEGSEKNKWQIASFATQMRLELDAVHAGHSHVGNHTRKFIELVRSKQLLGARKRVYDVSQRSHEAVSRYAHRFIIVNDCYERNI